MVMMMMMMIVTEIAMVSLAQVWHIKATSDDVVSREFGARHCGAHSPTKERPGPQGAAFSEAFAALGYAVGTAAAAVQSYPRPLWDYRLDRYCERVSLLLSPDLLNERVSHTVHAVPTAHD